MFSDAAACRSCAAGRTGTWPSSVRCGHRRLCCQAGAAGRVCHSRVRVLGQRPCEEREGAGRRARDRRDQGRRAAGPTIRRMVEGFLQFWREPRVTAGIGTGHPVSEERRAAHLLELAGNEHGTGGGGHVRLTDREPAQAQGTLGESPDDSGMAGSW